MSLEGAIAAHRFGLGARPGEIDSASRNPKAWLLAQIERNVRPLAAALDVMISLTESLAPPRQLHGDPAG